MAVPATMTGARSNPPFVKQAPDWQGCNVACARKSVKECLGSAVDLRELTYQKARKIMGATDGGPTGTAHVERLFRHYGMEKGVDYKIISYDPWTEARDLLKAGWAVTFYVWYGFVNSNAISYSGDRNFNGGHAIYTKHRWQKSLNIWLLGEHDPLHDNRRTNIPQGPVRVPQKLMRGATERYCIKNGGPQYAGRAVGYAVKRRG